MYNDTAKIYNLNFYPKFKMHLLLWRLDESCSYLNTETPMSCSGVVTPELNYVENHTRTIDHH